jgi:hypothetical protein
MAEIICMRKLIYSINHPIDGSASGDHPPVELERDVPPVELDLSKFLFEAIDVSPFMNVRSWSSAFDAIPVDPYIREGYRYKSIAWFRVKHVKAAAIAEIDERIAAVNLLSGMSEERSRSFLSTGDLRREYQPISDQITDSLDFRKLLDCYASFFGWSDAIVLVQFQRVDCFAGKIGLPAVEGFHQDGNRHVGMLVVNRVNLTDDSGVCQYVLYDHGKKTEEMVFNSVIPAGKLIFWNDKRVWHYGTEIKVADSGVNGGRGIRDIVILSAKTPPANMPIGPVPDPYRNW